MNWKKWLTRLVEFVLALLLAGCAGVAFYRWCASENPRMIENTRERKIEDFGVIVIGRDSFRIYEVDLLVDGEKKHFQIIKELKEL